MARRPGLVLAAAAAVVLLAARGRASNCAGTSTGLVPLNDLGAGRYLGQFQGGLYPNGSNAIPAMHLQAGLSAASRIVPRTTAGVPNLQQGRVVLISIGLSNTTLEFCISGSGTTNCTPESFMGQAAVDPAVNHTTLAIVNGAIAGEGAERWVDPASPNYDSVASLLASQGLSELQVQAVWVKEAEPVPTVSLPSADADAFVLEGRLAGIARALRTRYANVQQVFYSSRIYAGYASTNLNPEPWAYETGFAVKWAVEAQIRQMATPGTPPDPIAGDLDYTTVAPWIAWGPYLWADGTTPRSDGLDYVCTDFIGDGTHPADGAIQKVGSQLLDFLLAAPMTRPWFAAGAGGSTTTSTTIRTGTSTTTTTRTSASTTTTTLAPPPPCPAQPRSGCQPANSRHARLSLADSATNARDRLSWRWVSNVATPKAAFGTPTATTGYALCLYDATGLRRQARAPAGGTCGRRPCWRDARSGFRYVGSGFNPDGLESVGLVAGGARAARIRVKGKGAGLHPPALPLAIPVRMQLLRSGSSACWEARYSRPPTRNGAGRFDARSD
jgi:hypothetical protein